MEPNFLLHYFKNKSGLYIIHREQVKGTILFEQLKLLSVHVPAPPAFVFYLVLKSSDKRFYCIDKTDLKARHLWQRNNSCKPIFRPLFTLRFCSAILFRLFLGFFTKTTLELLIMGVGRLLMSLAVSN